MEKAITTLNEVKESIINAYAAKTGLSRNRISKLMSDETWLNAKKALELGFADEILFADKPKEDETEEEPDEKPDEPDKEEEGGDEEEEQKKPFKLKEADAVWQYSTRVMGQTILNRLGVSDEAAVPKADTPAQEPAEAGVTDPPVEDDKPKVPVIGMDGKTEDGSVPYEILKDRLEWMK
jgi:ATP-dependent Clp protease protease subunit